MSGSEGRRRPILVVDDEPQVREALAAVLASSDEIVEFAASAEEGLAMAAERVPDAVILDLTLPQMSGLEACRRLRDWYDGPILILSVRGGEQDKIAALDSGADDYLTKPFGAGELRARLRALLRRAKSTGEPLTQIRVGALCIDFPRRLVTLDDEPVRLTKLEFEVLAVLAHHAGRVVTSRMLLDRVWGPMAVDDTQALRVHISHLGQKLEQPGDVPRYILTEPGVGFRLAEPDDVE